MRRDIIIIGLAEGWKIEQIADAAGVSPKTILNKYANDPEIQAEVRKIREETRKRIANQVTNAAVEAIRTLKNLLYDDKPPIRLGAAKIIMESFRALKEERSDDEGQKVPIEKITEFIARFNESHRATAAGDTVGATAGSAEPGLPEPG